MKRYLFPFPQRGAVAITLALAMAVLIGFVGLALDVGRLYVTRGELQNAADSCALASAQDLTGANPLAIAEAAGITAGSGNRVMFQNEAVALQVDSSVQFSTALNGVYNTKDAVPAADLPNIKYVRCSVSRAGIPTWFMRVLNLLPGVQIGDQTVVANAVATRIAAQTNCALPVAICTTALTPEPPKGTWLQGVIGPSGGQDAGSGGLTGNFKWIDFSPPQGGAAELSGVLTGSGACNLASVGSQVGQPGNVASAAQAWNSRFGIYQGSVTPSVGVPDYTGYAYTEVNWPSMANAYDDFRARRAANAPYEGNAITGLHVNGTIEGGSFLLQNGADRRLAIAPVVDCSGFVTSSTAPVVSWACVLLLHPLNQGAGGSGTGSDRMYLEYRGASNDPDSPCASLGVPGTGASLGPLVPVLAQ